MAGRLLTLRSVNEPPAFLDGLDEAERTGLLQIGRPRRWSPGESIVRAADPVGTAIILLRGVAKVHAASPHGQEVILGLAGAGDLLGEIGAIREARRSASVTALGAVEGSVLDVEDLREFLVGQPRVLLALLDLALARLRNADRQRLAAATSDTLPRVAGRLVELVERFGGPEPSPDGSLILELPLTQEELAAWSGCSRESTARALRTLRDLNLIETRRRHLTVHDLPALRRQARDASPT
jgi:CRP/FNR family cyclic AMP-dependent transcriptional regulator